MEQKPPLFEPGDNDGMALFLYCLGRGCVSRSNHSGCLENCRSIEQYSAVVDDSTGVAADGTGDANGVSVVLLADRGFADGKLIKYLRQTLNWHFRIRIKRSFQFELHGQ